MKDEATPAKVRPNDGLGVCHPERCADCDLLNGCREYCRCSPALPPARGCHECAWGKVAGCWRCGSR